MLDGLPELADLDRAALAVLGREWLLHGHLQDRVGMALVMEHLDREEMQQVAIEEWMAASPVYSLRMQRAFGFSGDGVDTICKNLQLDIGAPHEFMDFRFRIDDVRHGEFWLAHCGALMDVEPMGEDFVHGMCHTIEDPTFDATAAATNPLAAIRPIHRPPRLPVGRTPHCRWRIDIVADGPPVAAHPNQSVVARSLAAKVALDAPASEIDADGLADYSGEFDPEFRLENLSHHALVVALQEFALQSHLLLRALLLSVDARLGPDVVQNLTPRLVAGWSGLTAQRLRAAFDLPATAQGLATMLALHPMFAPRDYIGCTVSRDGEIVRLGFSDCPAAHEDDAYTWFGGLNGPMDAAIAGIAIAFDPRARCAPVAAHADEIAAYAIVLDAEGAPAEEPPELAIAKISTGARFRFRDGTARLPVLT